jgi:hypothetical protein
MSRRGTLLELESQDPPAPFFAFIEDQQKALHQVKGRCQTQGSHSNNRVTVIANGGSWPPAARCRVKAGVRCRRASASHSQAAVEFRRR